VSTEDELPDDDELADDELRPALVGDGDVFFYDPIDLMEMTGSVAIQVRDGGVFVLKLDGLKWVAIEDSMKSRPVVVQAVKTRQ